MTGIRRIHTTRSLFTLDMKVIWWKFILCVACWHWYYTKFNTVCFVPSSLAHIQCYIIDCKNWWHIVYHSLAVHRLVLVLVTKLLKDMQLAASQALTLHKRHGSIRSRLATAITRQTVVSGWLTHRWWDVRAVTLGNTWTSSGRKHRTACLCSLFLNYSWRQIHLSLLVLINSMISYCSQVQMDWPSD